MMLNDIALEDAVGKVFKFVNENIFVYVDTIKYNEYAQTAIASNYSRLVQGCSIAGVQLQAFSCNIGSSIRQYDIDSRYWKISNRIPLAFLFQVVKAKTDKKVI